MSVHFSFTVGKTRISVGKTGIRVGGRIGDMNISKKVVDFAGKKEKKTSVKTENEQSK